MGIDSFKTDDSENSNNNINTESTTEVTKDSRLDRKRGPYIDPEAYKRLKNASDMYDMTVRDAIDRLLLSAFYEDGEVKEPHSVLRKEMKD